MVVYNASSVPIIQLALSSDTHLADGAQRSRAELHQAAADERWPARRLPYAYGGTVRQVQIDLGPARRSTRTACRLWTSAPRSPGRTSSRPSGRRRSRSYEYTVDLNDSPKRLDDFNNLPVKVVNGAVVFMRDVAFVHNGSPAADQRRPARRSQRRAHVGAEDRFGLDARHYRRSQGAPAGDPGDAAARRRPEVRRRPVGLRPVLPSAPWCARA